jgi:hypothetical protein
MLQHGLFLTLAAKSGFALVRTEPVLMYVASDYQIFAVPSVCGPAARAAFEVQCKELFASAQVWICKRCGHTVNQFEISKGGGECVTYYHPGKRIPFADGKMEHEEGDSLEEKPLIIVRWSCCNEVIIDDSGCCQYVNPNGHARPGESEVEILSKFSLQIYNVP